MSTATVTFRLTGPQQAWSTRERSSTRPTQDHPTKSGVIGLVANALGRDRTDDINDLRALRLGVRADRAGRIESDFHTSGSGSFPLLPSEVLSDPALARTASKGAPLKRTYSAPKNIDRDSKGSLVAKRTSAILTTDEYLCDADFTIALSGPRELVDRIARALTDPARSLHLGRRAYPLSAPPDPTVHSVDDPTAALDLIPPRHSQAQHLLWTEEHPTRGPHPDTEIVIDQPTRFDNRHNAGRLEKRHISLPSSAAPANSIIDFFAPEEHP
ncbi:type I-E CRISPR-associated protein Cas5/CasD [Rhodococcoides fascians]|uniref:type I-E CRISPR-associated protein Cas5/CasD n=1 Tax=Rhodococcoides fascians TaxID=1828 RepID=UPI00068A3EBC|nr:type I-E CRISPR-associated protein Cas5/CasD [Rhodococcus fascians]